MEAIVYHTLIDREKAELVNGKPDVGVVERGVVTKEIVHLTNDRWKRSLCCCI